MADVVAGEYVSHLGGRYEVLGVSASTVDNSLSVVMKPLSGVSKGKLFHMPLEQFLGNTTYDSKSIPRFARRR